MLITPGAESLAEIVAEMRAWSFEPDQASLHVGDVGWNQQFGASALAAALRVWRLDNRVAAVGLLDEPELLRLTVAPERRHDEDFILELAADLAAADGRVLPAGEVALEARFEGPLHGLLLAQGWDYDEPWTPLVRDLSADVPEHHLRIEDVDPDRLEDRLAVHRDHQGRGHGRAICLAAAAALQEMGASHAFVSTPSSNVGAVATYQAAGYEEKPQVRDLRRRV